MPISRRDFLRCAAGLAGAVLPCPRLLAQPRFDRNPYSLGVASGYPGEHGVVLWTRLAPDPLAGGGMPPAAVEVGWEVAADEAFRSIVRRGTEIAAPEWAHSVHAEVAGLEPGRWYFYRFHAGGRDEPGRPDAHRAAARPGGAHAPSPSRPASSTSRAGTPPTVTWPQEDLDLVVHLGDYIYESSWGRNHVRKHGTEEPWTLADYRNRYALYKSDPDLQAAHAAFPWLVTWDDHEVQNDYANDRSQYLDDPQFFLERRAAAYRAYYEHMPLPKRMRPRGPDMRIYTRAEFGALAAFHVLDDRQYRVPPGVPAPWTRRQQRRAGGGLPRAPRPGAHAARASTGEVAAGGADGLPRALERDRAADPDGAGGPHAWRGAVVLDRRLGRVSGGARAAAAQRRGKRGRQSRS